MALGRKTGGRTAGTPNKVTASVRELAEPYGPAAIVALAQLAGLTDKPGAEAEATRIAALRELLDRAYGKAKQPTETDQAPESLQLQHLIAAQACSRMLQAELATASTRTIDAEVSRQPNGPAALFEPALE